MKLIDEFKYALWEDTDGTTYEVENKCEKIAKQEMLFFGEWIFDQFNLNKDVSVSKILNEYLIINKK